VELVDPAPSQLIQEGEESDLAEPVRNKQEQQVTTSGHDGVSEDVLGPKEAADHEEEIRRDFAMGEGTGKGGGRGGGGIGGRKAADCLTCFACSFPDFTRSS
jgi:hypothetical protein